MSKPATALERAFDLAKSGQVSTIDEIRNVLKHEGLDVNQVQGPALLRQLRALMEASRE